MTRNVQATFRIKVSFDPDRSEFKEFPMSEDPTTWTPQGLASLLATFPGNPIVKMESAECTWVHRENSARRSERMESEGHEQSGSGTKGL